MDTLASILEPLSTVVIPATIGTFIAKEKFVLNTEPDAPLQMCCLSDNFTEYFLNGVGKTEGPMSVQTLCYAKLREASMDGPIIRELGGEAKVITTLSGMFFLMGEQGHGEPGFLLNNGEENIFYILDRLGVGRVVSVSWGNGWGICANFVNCASMWSAGEQVFYYP